MNTVERIPVICKACGHTEHWPKIPDEDPDWVKAISAATCFKCAPLGDETFNETQYRDQEWLDLYNARTNPNQLSLL